MGALAKINKGPGKHDDIGPSMSMDEYASFATKIDLATRNGSIGANSPQELPRGVIVSDAGAGTKKLNLTMPDGVVQSYDFTNLVGVLVPISPRFINTSTTIARVLVLY